MPIPEYSNTGLGSIDPTHPENLNFQTIMDLLKALYFAPSQAMNMQGQYDAWNQYVAPTLVSTPQSRAAAPPPASAQQPMTMGDAQMAGRVPLPPEWQGPML